MFYDPKQPYYEFTNFFKSSMTIDGIQCFSVEHFYQSQKFFDPSKDLSDQSEYFELMTRCDSPRKVKLMGCQKVPSGYGAKWRVWNDPSTPLIGDIIKRRDASTRSDWEAIKVDVMHRATSVKFSSDPRLRKLLLSTVGCDLVEDSPRDAIWGIGKDGKGLNLLGKVLMKVRDEMSQA